MKMEQALQSFLTQKTDIELTEIVLFIAKHQLETLHLERNIIKQTSPLNKMKFQHNTDILNSCVEAIMSLEEMLKRQQN